MKVVDLNVDNGDEINLYANGKDEQIAINTLKNFLLNKEKKREVALTALFTFKTFPLINFPYK